MRTYIPVLLSLLACSAAAQRISIGIKGGVPLTDASKYGDESRPYIIGPSIEVRLFGNFAVEGAALYQRVGSTTSYPVPFNIPAGTNLYTYVTYTTRQRGNAWQFPVLGKYYFRPRSATWRPYVGTGYSFGTTWFTADYRSTEFNGHYHYRSPTTVGAVFAAGVRLRAGRLALLPELRLTRWGTPYPLTRKTQTAFLLGLQF